MKKNRMMRLASVLLVLVLLSTSVISGTFAKYVTTATANDTARVAKWGITMDTDNTGTFVATYSSNGQETVHGKNSENDADVVAPGTSGTATYVVSGTPETDYVITFAGVADDDVYLAKDLTYTYVDAEDNNGVVTYTTPGPGASGTVSADYYPIYYTVTITAANGSFDAVDSQKTHISTTATAQNFDTLAAAMAALSNTKVTYDANEAAAMTVTIGWEWAFEATTETVDGRTNIVDAYDTVLGDIVANNADLTVNNTTAGTSGFAAKVTDKYNTTIGYTLAITATQVD